MTGRRARTLLLLALSLGAVALGWKYRRAIERTFAPAESDYTPEARVAPTYPRPNADLTPVWRVELEPGYGGAAIQGGEVFVLDREVGVADTLRVFDLETGDPLWTFSYDEPGRLSSAGSRTTPVVEGELVYLCSPFGRVHCVSRETHELAWSTHLEENGGELPDFGWAASPLLYEHLVILPALGEKVGLVAFDRFSGERVWQSSAVGFSHSTPVILNLLGREQLLFQSSTVQGHGRDVPVLGTVHAFDPATGEELWTFQSSFTSVAIPPPVRVADDLFFLTGGYGGGSSLVRLSEQANEFVFDEVFHVDKGSQFHPPVVHEDHIYLLANENSNDSRRKRRSGGLTCYDLTGREVWTTGDDPYLGRGHMILLAEFLLIQDGLSGMVRMCRATPQGYQPLATANVFDSPPKERKRMWAKMAFRGSTLVVRGQSELRCVRMGDRSAEYRR